MGTSNLDPIGSSTDHNRWLVWDVPVRLAHVLLMVGLVTAFTLAAASDDDGPVFSLHMVFGSLFVAVALFRIVWGFIGTRHARFTAFEWRPARVGHYLWNAIAGRAAPHVGHNPATSYVVAAMLVLGLGIGLSGALMTMGIEGELEEAHELLAFTLLGTALLHMAGVGLQVIHHRDDLVLSMVDGKKAVAREVDAAPPAWGAAACLLVLALAIVGVALAGYDPQRGTLVLPGVGWRPGDHESGEEHYHPRRHREEHDDDDD